MGDYYNKEAIDDIAAQRKQQATAVETADEQKEKDTPAPESTQMERRHSKGRQFMNLIKNPFSSSNNAKLSHIQSAAMTDDDKTKSLAVFKLEGLDLATPRSDAFLQDSWDPVIVKREAQKSNESPKRKPPPPRPAPFHQEGMDKHSAQKPLLDQKLSVQPIDLLKKPRRLVQRSHSSASSTSRVNKEELTPPAVAPRNHRPTSHLPQGLKKPLIPPVRRSSAKTHNHVGNESKVL